MFKKLVLFIVLIGAVLLTVGIVRADGDINKFIETFNSDLDFTYKEEKGNDLISQIDIELKSGNIVFHFYDEVGYKVDFYESTYNKKIVSVVDGKLSIHQEIENKIKWFSFSFNSNKINTVNLYIPKSYEGKVNINSLSGNVKIENFNFEQLNAYVTSGNITIKEVSSETSINLRTTSGNINLNEVEAKLLNINTTSGNISLTSSRIVDDIKINAMSGNIKLYNIKANQLIGGASSGNVELNQVDVLDIELRVTSGNISVDVIDQIDNYRIEASVVSGDIYYKGSKIKGRFTTSTGERKIKVNTTSGNIRLS